MTANRLIERFGPAFFALVATAMVFLYLQHLSAKDFETFRDKFGNSALSISTSMLGFFLTIYTIIHAINTERMNALRANGAYGRLMGFLHISLYSHALVIGLVLFFCLPALGPMCWHASNWVLHLWLAFVAVVAWSVAVSLRFVRIFLKLVDAS